MMGNFIKTQTEAAMPVLSEEVSGAKTQQGGGDTCVWGRGADIYMHEQLS